MAGKRVSVPTRHVVGEEEEDEEDEEEEEEEEEKKKGMSCKCAS